MKQKRNKCLVNLQPPRTAQDRCRAKDQVALHPRNIPDIRRNFARAPSSLSTSWQQASNSLFRMGSLGMDGRFRVVRIPQRQVKVGHLRTAGAFPEICDSPVEQQRLLVRSTKPWRSASQRGDEVLSVASVVERRRMVDPGLNSFSVDLAVAVPVNKSSRPGPVHVQHHG
jgi:hypothetical protein